LIGSAEILAFLPWRCISRNWRTRLSSSALPIAAEGPILLQRQQTVAVRVDPVEEAPQPLGKLLARELAVLVPVVVLEQPLGGVLGQAGHHQQQGRQGSPEQFGSMRFRGRGQRLLWARGRPRMPGK